MILEEFLTVCCNAKVFSKANGSLKCMHCDKYITDPLEEMTLNTKLETTVIVTIAETGNGNPVTGFDSIRDAFANFKGKSVTVTIKENQLPPEPATSELGSLNRS